MLKDFKTTYLDKQTICEDTVSFNFEKPAHFEYQSGQFIELFLEHNPGVAYPFTLSSFPGEPYLTITTRMWSQSKFKIWLETLVPGQMVTMTGPWGNFVLEEGTENLSIFLAGGIGITPFRSMVKEAIDSEKNLPSSIFHSNKFSRTTPFKKEFEALLNRGVQLYYLMTQEGSERLSFAYINSKENITRDSRFYISGAPVFIDTLADDLVANGIKEKMIRVDSFSGY